MNYEERKKYRMTLLRKVYEHYFNNDGAALGVTRDDLSGSNERKLAYEYLVDKGLLSFTAQGSNRLYKPTVYGIDYIESLE